MNNVLNKKVNQWKNQLLDLSRRNRMIQLRQTGMLNLIEPDCEMLFNRIYVKEESLTFSYEPDRRQNPRLYSFSQLFSELNAPLDIRIGEILTEESATNTQRTLRNLYNKSELSLEEQSINILYLCIGVLRWSGGKYASGESLMSPVLLVPTVLHRTSLSDPYTISRSDDDAVVNPTLSYLMQSELNLNLPEFDPEEEDISGYLKKMDAFARSHGWEMRHEARLGLMSFQKISMYKDIKNNLERIENHPVLLALAGDSSKLPTAGIHITEQDDMPSRDVFDVLGADSSQQEAILYARKGISFVMQGPPGTGKSQTIANIIAASLADGKKVLFVSEKAAALEVVYKRLCDVMLGDFCLPLHSAKTSKRTILDRLCATLERDHFSVKESALARLDQLDTERDQLNRYVSSLHRTVEPLGLSVYELFAKLLELEDVPEIMFELPDVEQYTQGDLFRMEQQLRKYNNAAQKLHYQVQDHPWTGILTNHAGMEYTNAMRTHLTALNICYNKITPLLAALEEMTVDEEWLCEDLTARLETLQQFAVLRYAPENWFTTGRQEALSDTARYLRQKAERMGKLEADIRQVLTEDSFRYDAQEWIGRWNSLKRGLSALPVAPSIDTIFPESAQMYMEYLGILQNIRANVCKTAELVQCPSPTDLKQTDQLLEWIERISDVIPCRREWMDTSQLARHLTVLRELAESETEEARLTEELLVHFRPELLDESMENHLDSFRQYCTAQGLSAKLNEYLVACRVGEIQADNIENINLLDNLLQQLLGILMQAEQTTGIPLQAALSSLTLFENAAKLCENHALLERIWLDGGTDPVSLRAALREIEEISRNRGIQQQHILEEFRDQALDFDYEAVLQRYRAEYTSFLKVLSPSWHRDRKTIRTMHRSGKNLSDAEIMQYLLSMEQKHETENNFQKKADTGRHLFGTQYREYDTPWQEIRCGIELTEQLIALFGTVPPDGKIPPAFAEKAVHSRILLCHALTETAAQISSLTAQIRTLSTELHLNPEPAKIYENVHIAAEYLHKAETLKNGYIAYLSGFLIKAETLSAEDASTVLEKAVHCRMLRTKVMQENVSAELRPLQKYVKWKDVLHAVQTIESLRREKAPKNLLLFLCQEHPETTTAALANYISTLRGDIALLQECTVLRNICSLTFEQAEQQLTRIIGFTGDILKLTAEVKPLTIAEIPTDTLVRSMNALAEYQSVQAYFTSNAEMLSKLFGPMYQGVHTHFDTICQAVRTAEKFRSLDLPETFFTVVCRSQKDRSRLAAVSAEIVELYHSALPHIQWIDRQFHENSRLSNLLLSEQTERVYLCLNKLDSLQNWLDYCRIRQECLSAPCAGYIRTIEKHQNFDDISASFVKGFYSKLIDRVLQQDAVLAGFRFAEQDAHIENFRKLDREKFILTRHRILSKLIEQLPDSTKLLHVNDETSILRKQMTTKRPMPLRKLFTRIPNLLQRLSPCLMMSPLSVSHFLEAQTYQFDLVIFDEASQIRPEDAVGAILRGRQVIIAGDTKQMPPTNFFKSSGSGGENDAEEETEEELASSILEEAACALPGKTLLWHYRSRHESLITFSNQAIYHGHLITFPSFCDSANLGVHFVYVPDGVYENNQNLAEANRCVQLLEEHIRRHPRRSLGIIAFSEKQQDAIQEAVDKLRLANPQHEHFFRAHPDEPFFVKNLENVQGDERDAILFSICYAKNRQGRMFMRFGPLGQNGGERRLNVAITRAKCSIQLVSSILPEDLRDAKAQGVILLREYMQFAQKGIFEQSASMLMKIPEESDDFCCIIANFLEQQGYQIRRNVGSSSYRIDIGVLYPGKEHQYLAGIECDGDSYRKAKTARDRDILRPSILENMGWHMYRVWATEWLRTEQTEKERLLKFLEDSMQDHNTQQTSPAAENDTVPEDDLITMILPKQEKQREYAVYKPVAAGQLIAIHSLTDYDMIAYDLRIIAEAEQPVHLDLVFRRMMEPMGISRLAPNVKNAIRLALDQARHTGLELDSNDFLWSVPRGAAVPRRPESPGKKRQPEQIANEEIMNLMKDILQSAIGLTKDDLIAETAAVFGYERMGERIRERFLEATDRMIREHKIIVAEDKLRWNGSDEL